MKYNGEYAIRLGYKYLAKNPQSLKIILIKYILLNSFILMIVRELLCLFSPDETTRLYLFDLSLFVGGIRQFTSMFMIFGLSFSVVLFKLLFLPRNEKYSKWTEIIAAVIGENNPGDFIILKHDFAKLIKLKNIYTKFVSIIFIYNGNYI